MDTGRPVSRFTASTMGSTRAASSSALTGVWPGRVDSPPMSIMAAPSSAMRPACLSAASRSVQSPPSEKESGVTFRMPMTYTPFFVSNLRFPINISHLPSMCQKLSCSAASVSNTPRAA